MHSFPLCRFCQEPLRATLVDLGSTPLANSYLAPEQLAAPEPTFPLHARLCSACRLVQVDDVAAPGDIFGHYAYFSSYSASWVEHARRFAVMASEALAVSAPTVSWSKWQAMTAICCGISSTWVSRCLAVEPAANVAEAARAAGVTTDVCFFGRATAERLRSARARSRSHRRQQCVRARSRYQRFRRRICRSAQAGWRRQPRISACA